MFWSFCVVLLLTQKKMVHHKRNQFIQKFISEKNISTKISQKVRTKDFFWQMDISKKILLLQQTNDNNNNVSRGNPHYSLRKRIII